MTFNRANTLCESIGTRDRYSVIAFHAGHLDKYDLVILAFVV
jgi:hypothetical protein